MWIATWTPAAWATVRQASMAAGVVPQSSCSLNPDAPARSCSRQALGADRVALAQQRDVDRPVRGGGQHGLQPEGARRDRGRLGPLGRAGAAADQRGHPGRQRDRDLLRGDQVHVAVDAARGEDHPVSRQDLRRRPDDQAGRDAVHGVRVARLAQGHDPAVPHADVGLDHAPVVEHHRPGDDQVRGALGPGGDGLAHRLADDLAAAEDGLVPGQRAGAAAAVLGHLDEQVGVGQPDPVPGRGPVQSGVPGPGDLSHRGGPPIPAAARAPPARRPAPPG